MAHWQPLRTNFIRFYCSSHRTALRAHKALKTANQRERLHTWRDAFSAHSALQFRWIHINLYIYIYISININKGHRQIHVKRALSSQSFGLTPVRQQAGSLWSNRQREWAGVTPALIERSHGLCALDRSCACVRACLLPLWSSGRAEAMRLGIVSSLLPSLPLSLLHSRYNILPAPT